VITRSENHCESTFLTEPQTTSQTPRRGGGEEEEKEIQPDSDKEKKSTAISFCRMGGFTSTSELAMLWGAREAIVFSLSHYLSR